jgi:hypothetical protein
MAGGGRGHKALHRSPVKNVLVVHAAWHARRQCRQPLGIWGTRECLGDLFDDAICFVLIAFGGFALMQRRPRMYRVRPMVQCHRFALKCGRSGHISGGRVLRGVEAPDAFRERVFDLICETKFRGRIPPQSLARPLRFA